MTTWEDISKEGGSKAVKAFMDIWYKDKRLDYESIAILRPLYEKYSIEERNFKAWVKQRVRQLFENSRRNNASKS